MGIVAARSAGTYFQANRGSLFRPANVTEFGSVAQAVSALRDGAVDAVYADTVLAAGAVGSGYQWVHATSGWSHGVAYGCHPEYGDIVQALNGGLAAFRATPGYAALCSKFPSVACAPAAAANDATLTLTLTNSPSASPGPGPGPGPRAAPRHPTQRADIVIGMDPNFPPYSELRDGVLVGFDVELTAAVCARAGRVCAVVTVPWLSAWATDHSRFGWPTNVKEYPGEGQYRRLCPPASLRPSAPALCAHVPPYPGMYLNGRTPQEEGGGPPPLVPFQCLRLTAKILLRRLRRQEDLSFKIFGPPSAGTIGEAKEEGAPANPPSPFRPPLPPF